MASENGDESAVRFPSNTERDPATGRPITQYGKIKEATGIATSGAAAKARLVQMPMNQVSKAVHDLWKEYERKMQDRKEARANKKKSSESVPEGLSDAQQAQEVFVLLASLGERLLALDVFEPAVYAQALEDVKTNLSVVNIAVLREQFDLLTLEQQYPVTAAIVFSTFFYPMPLYRGYGACVLEDWDWGCLDVDALLKEKVKDQGSWISRIGKDPPVAQPNQAVLQGFDRVINLLQGKRSCKEFLVKKPAISGLVSTHVRLEPRPKKDVKKDLELLEDFTKEIKKRGHPGPEGVAITAWSLPFATWRSKYNCIMLNDWESTMMQQQDPGRILHAYLNKEVLSLSEGHILALPPGTLAETLACWMEGLPGTRHRTLRWHSLDTVEFATKMKKASKSVHRKLGQYPLPNTFVIAGDLVQRQPSSTLAREMTPSRSSVPSPQVITNRANDADDIQAPPPYARATHSGSQIASTLLALCEGSGSESADALSSLRSWTASPESPSPELIRRKPMPSREVSSSSIFGNSNEKPSPSREISSSSVLGFANEKAHDTEEPFAESSTTRRETVADSTSAPKLSPPAPSPLANENYLDLLNEVAQGRITPQQLSQMLKVQPSVGAATSQSLRAQGVRGSKAVAGLPPQNDLGEFREPWNVSIGPSGIFEMPTDRDPVETDGIAKGNPRNELPNNEVHIEDELQHVHQSSTSKVSEGAETHNDTFVHEPTSADGTCKPYEFEPGMNDDKGAEGNTGVLSAKDRFFGKMSQVSDLYWITKPPSQKTTVRSDGNADIDPTSSSSEEKGDVSSNSNP